MLRKGQLPLLLVNIMYIILFSVYFTYTRNYEFIIYMSTIVFFLIVVLLTNRYLVVPNGVWWAITALALAHLCGGMVRVGGARLYDLMIIPLSATLPVLRYDQLVHGFGFVCITLFVYYVTRSWAGGLRFSRILLFVGVLVLVAVLHESYEEIISITIPATGIGDFTDTALDVIFDLLGGTLTLGVLWLQEHKVLYKRPAKHAA